VTLLRAWMISEVAGFILAPPRHGWWAWAPGVLYTIAAVCDLVDGYVARRRGEISAVGGRLDVAVDGVGLLMGSLAAIVLGRLPTWYLALGSAYYLFHGELWLRHRRGRPVHMDRLRPSLYTRQFAGCQMGLVATALFPVLGPPGTTITAAIFMTPSLVLFVRDWLVVIGRIDAARGAETLGRLGLRLASVLALPFRVIGALGTAYLIGDGGVPAGVVVLPALVATGVLTRISAFAAAVAVARLLQEHASVLAVATFVALVTVIVTGAGRTALWSPEDRLMLRRAGDPP
jgi:CDP-diacylglycerol--glycerol-3-phosphate 3-phosphatidyltransferase